MFISAFVPGCHDRGEEILSTDPDVATGPFASTNKVIYEIGEPVTATIASDTLDLRFYECSPGQPPFFLDILLTAGWAEWSDNATRCMEGSGPKRIQAVSSGATIDVTIIPPTNYPGTYRLRIALLSMRNFRSPPELVTNNFEIQD
jgi:hypothetical protein